MRLETFHCSRCKGTGNVHYQTIQGPRVRKGCATCGSTGTITHNAEWAQDVVARRAEKMARKYARQQAST